MRPKNDATKKRSKVTGKKFNRQDPNGRRHGPQPRRKVYAMAIEKVLDSHWGDEWLTSGEIAYMANKDVSNFFPVTLLLVLFALFLAFLPAIHSPSHYFATQTFSALDATTCSPCPFTLFHGSHYYGIIRRLIRELV